ncbi:LOW QUALITY PROTEIN: CBL-interacting serine/threonine-protein kinase 11-like [Phalaenopsis equestris]|uniref:LOW QUALITY PROTEIN: CBL-interacting serine/threonine-protein kinase 11-like n=1 Tax=Phalaenopsis equestris TaxID=78828 RepID=UPI0009E3A843|nr:LOW QUALITY PROTEIN: CBL-interacting serine/threonine-protein kinase 11-like [Phalaenopsis equestris]
MPDSGDDPLAEFRWGAETKVLLGKYELGRLLGCGSSAKVYLARNLRTGQTVAIKCFSKLRLSKSELVNHVKREISILRLLRHPNIIHLHEVLASRSKIYLVLDYVKGGELFERVFNAGRLSENLCRRYFQQLISSVGSCPTQELGYCHSRGVFHRDLKLENLLLDENGDLKVSDFGLSAIPDMVQADGLFHTLCGTPAYVAPEILAKKGYSAATVDLWSCGIILFVLFTGYLPFNDSNLMAMYRKIYRGEFRCPKWTSFELRHLIGRLLDKNPETRITVEEIMTHPWFRKGLDAKKWAAMASFQEEGAGDEEYKISKAEAVDAEKRQLNAFDIIGFSSGVDLSGLFGVQKRERFISGEAPEKVLRRVEEAGRSEGLVVSRKGEKGSVGVALRGQCGNFVVGVEVYRLSEDLTLLEVQRGRFMEGRERWAGEFWRENSLRDRVTPVVDSVSGTAVNR